MAEAPLCSPLSRLRHRSLTAPSSGSWSPHSTEGMGPDAACGSDGWDFRHNHLRSPGPREAGRTGTCDRTLQVIRLGVMPWVWSVVLALPLVGPVCVGEPLTSLSPGSFLGQRKVMIPPP